MELVLDLINDDNIPIRATIDTEVATDDEVIVKFYDRRHNFDPHGQFTGANYYLSTLVQDRDRLQNGLNLHGGVDDWSLGANQMSLFFQWVDQFYTTG